MLHNNFPRGSEWQKWDLHIHTPASILNNEFGDDWDEYVKQLFRAAIANKIVAIGVTDYFMIEGYKKLRIEYLQNPTKMAELFSEEEVELINNILVIPNIEFRINKLIVSKERSLQWNSKVNLHLLLSDEIDIEEIEQNLLHRLTFEDNAMPDSVSQTNPLTKRNLQELGKKLKEEHSQFRNKSDLFVGIMNAAIDDKELFEKLNARKEKFEGKYLIGISADEDLSPVDWNSQGHLARKLLIQKSNFLFSSNPGTIRFGLGKTSSTIEEFCKEFKTLKPCIWGSDAHSFEKLFKSDADRFTWIKANATFEGLRQILYEPSYRVNIGETKPEEKTPYLVIDKIRFLDASTNKVFSMEWIYLNQNLNTIIGGKSSGKSLLLYHIAKTLDKIQVADKIGILSATDYEDFRFNYPFDFEVYWCDGSIKKLSDPDEEVKNQITYIPQLYINHLAEEKGEKHLSDLIESILLQNSDYKIFKETTDKAIDENLSTIKGNIELLISFKKDFDRIKSETAGIGEKSKINDEINRLTKRIEELRKASGFNETENKIYEKLSNQEKYYDSKLNRYNSIIKSVKDFSTYISSLEVKLNDIISKKKDEFGTYDLEIYLIEKLENEILLSLKNSFISFNSLSNTDLSKLDSKNDFLRNELEDKRNKLVPFREKIKNQKELTNLSLALKTEQNKIIKIDEKAKDLKQIVEKAKQVRENIINAYKSIYDSYKNVEIELQKDKFKNIGEGLQLKCELTFDTDKFSSFTNLFDGRSKFNTQFYGVFDDNNQFRFIKDSHYDNIRLIFDKLRELDKIGLRVKSGVSYEDLYVKLLNDYFKINYTISYRGDNILKMSPGKRGVVLLELILHLSNATHPILIDQPEDNLDNRTIYEELNQFIIDKKLRRQIIIVTHNANLVVSSDSENIIVANQAGQQIGKDKKEFTFEYVSGALENSFINTSASGILYQYGIREHVCDILEGGKEAFKKREKKYGII